MRLTTRTAECGVSHVLADQNEITLAGTPAVAVDDSNHWTANWTVQIPSTTTARPGGPAVDLADTRVAALAAEVKRLRAQLHATEVALDDCLDRESLYGFAAAGERLAPTAVLDLRMAPRAVPAPAPMSVGAVLWALLARSVRRQVVA